MQTTTLPIQSGAAAQAAARTNANASANADPSQFGAMLSQEIEQRQPPAPAARPAEQPKPAQADKADEPKATTPEPAKAADSKPAEKSRDSDSTAKADEDDDGKAAEHPATSQVTDMLALVASLNQTLKKTTAAATPDKAAAALAGARPGIDNAQLAALQSATRALGKDASDGVSAKATTGFEQFKNPAAALGLADAQAGKDAGAMLAKLKVQPETAALGEARDTLAQASALKDAAPNAQLLAQLQPATLAAAQLAAGVAPDHIPARVGSSGWDQQVGQKIVLMAGDGEQSAELTLNPPDLGPLQVVLNVSNDQASVEFSSNQLEVRQALENALPRLREMMSESGIALGNATVNAGMPDQRQAQGDGRSGAGRGSSSSRLDGTGPVTDTATRTTRMTRMGDNGMVDTFA